MKADIKRIMKDIFFLRDIKNPDYPDGCTRHSYSVQDKEARDYILKQCEELDLKVAIDGVGNIRARYSDEDNDSEIPILMGSHIDTVTSGGAYDGVVGVMCALETIRVIKENQVHTKHPLELVIFSEEEGSNFAGTLLGSKAIIGKLTAADLKEIKNDKGSSAFEVISSFGYDPGIMKDHVIKIGDIKAMIEMHIEQGDSLHHEGLEIGIVKTIAGQRTYKVTFHGISNHAGSTRMNSRHDPLVGASKVICGLKQEALDYEGDSAVGTVGKIFCQPNSSNAIGSQVDFYADIRDSNEDGIQYLSNKLKELVDDACEENGLSAQVELLAQSPVVHLDENITETLKKSAQRSGAKFKLTNSGAVHDSVMLTEIAPVGMLFVPSAKGLSHCPQEFTEENDIEKGCNILIDAVTDLACKKKEELMKTLIKNGTIVTAVEEFIGDILICDGKISTIGNNLQAENAKIIDAKGKYVLPGGVDQHTHFSFTYKGEKVRGFETSNAAAVGGTTTVIDFVNQEPGKTIIDSIKDYDEHDVKSKAMVDYSFHGIVFEATQEVFEEIPKLPAAGIPTLKLFMAYKGMPFHCDDEAVFKA